MSESRQEQLFTYLLREIGLLRKNMDELTSEIKRLHHAVDVATKVERAVTKEEKQAARDEARIDRFKNYQEGMVNNAT